MTAGQHKPDLDSRESIEFFVDLFYERLLADDLLAPIFIDVAEIELMVHLPHIKDYWCKLLLGEKKYQRHTMNIHRQLHAKRALQSRRLPALAGFFQCDGGRTLCRSRGLERAKQVAARIAANMEQGLAP